MLRCIDTGVAILSDCNAVTDGAKKKSKIQNKLLSYMYDQLPEGNLHSFGLGVHHNSPTHLNNGKNLKAKAAFFVIHLLVK